MTIVCLLSTFLHIGLLACICSHFFMIWNLSVRMRAFVVLVNRMICHRKLHKTFLYNERGPATLKKTKGRVGEKSKKNRRNVKKKGRGGERIRQMGQEKIVNKKTSDIY